MQKRYQVFVSSTFDDLQEERRQVWQTLIKFNYIVVGMETFPATNEEQFSYIKKQIQSSDYYIVIIGARYGSMADEEISFTEREFDFAVESNVPVLVFPIADPTAVIVKKTDNDPKKTKKLASFCEKAMRSRTVNKWSNADNLSLSIVQSLQNAIETNIRPGWIRGDQPSNEELLAEIRNLRLENDKLKKSVAAPSVSQKSVPKIDLSTEVDIHFSVSSKENKEKTGKIAVSLEQIVAEFNLTEAPDESTIEDCIRGAVSQKLDTHYEHTKITRRSDFEKVLLLLSSKKIIALNSTPVGLRMSHGEAWLIAIGAAKMK